MAFQEPKFNNRMNSLSDSYQKHYVIFEHIQKFQPSNTFYIINYWLIMQSLPCINNS